ncbi:hypothetical protein CFD26_103446 [Aspergillus turcosus]|uniref:Uncharacterized protein n=1 Tax=Aspergillus turcosus TaxID=1245748 RepID=A0A421DD26_9EURO|nr:hypothetical protein CFD26_103446 [Aspergillus turcosus]
MIQYSASSWAPTSHSTEAVFITRPLADTQEYLFRQLLTESGIQPHEVSYIEMDGTGTQAGDAVGMTSVLNTFAWDKSRPRNMPLHLGSVKFEFGHGESASDFTSLINVLLIMQKNRVPPHCGPRLRSINFSHRSGRAKSATFILLRLRLSGCVRSIASAELLSITSPAGGNTALLLEDAAVKDDAALRKNLQALADYIGSGTSPNVLSRIAYITTARRMHHSRRLVAPPVSFFFAGQGAQEIPMGRDIYENIASFREDIVNFDYIGRAHGFASSLPLVTDAAKLRHLRLWQKRGLVPSYVIGHSLEEFAALRMEGVLSISEKLYLAGERASLLEGKCTAGSHGMLSVKASAAEIKRVVADMAVQVACFNGSEDTVLSGANEDIDKVSEKLSGRGVQSAKLVLPSAFHSSQVDSMLEELEQLSGRLKSHAPTVPVISTLLGRVIAEAGFFGPGYIQRHCRDPVNFLRALEAAQSAGIMDPNGLGIEIGRKEDTFKTLSEVLGVLHLAGVLVNWDEYHLQKIVEEEISSTHARIVIESDFNDPELLPVALDHRVNGLVLCPRDYLAKKNDNGGGLLPDVGNMIVEKALLVEETDTRLLRALLDFDWSTHHGMMGVYSADNSGKRTVSEPCSVHHQPTATGSLTRQLKPLALLDPTQHQSTATGCPYRTSAQSAPGLAYKLFLSVVQYGPSYHDMEEIAFDSSGLEATTKVRCNKAKASFTMNCNDSLDLSDHDFINHGWRFMRCSEPSSADYVYQRHVRMQPVGDKHSLYSGDVFVLRDNKIVAHYGAVTFQKVARRVLEMLLPAPKPKNIPVRSISTTGSRPRPGSVPRKISADKTPQASTMMCCVHIADMGVDSLISLTILGTFRETLNLDVPASLFKHWLREYLGFPLSGTSSDDASIVSSTENVTAVTTPMAVAGEDLIKGSPVGSPEAVSAMIMAILAEEIGISTKELAKADEYDLAEVSLNSLLSLMVLGRVREEWGIDLPADLFMESNSPLAITVARPAHRLFSCVLTVSGSSTSYAMLPTISLSVCVYSMNCPYMRKPQDLKYALQDLTPPYMAEIRCRQPQGPYNLAGWSAGGIAAYDAAQYLVQQGETVERLFLRNSPNPIGL